MNIQQCTVIVSGGASGLGEAVVKYVTGKGGRAAILDLDAVKGEKLSAELGDSVIFCKTDVTDEASVEKAIYETINTFGSIHAAVNCAGIVAPRKVIGKDGQPMPIAFFNQVIQINLIGTMNVIRLAAVEMLKNTPGKDGERGVVVNVSSAAAFEGQTGQAAYSASKAAIVGMTLPLAREFSDEGIRFATIAPGLFMTPMMADLPEKAQSALVQMMPFPKRLGHPEEFAMLAAQIIENPMINGETIRLDAALRLASK
ncbi:MAG: SDR family NAD(P)-dependent oxidoreductase [Desulfobacteraceae bacterium]|nr:MAG: SDR family NAD(P)-dependent oxidoreductase [Desulfobacteraceae bacterium]